MNTPSNSVKLICFRNRLAQFRKIKSLPQFWEARWLNKNIGDFYTNYKKGYLGEFKEIFLRYLPRDLPVLEAGCGLGELVVALRANGFQAEGVDNAKNTIIMINKLAPDVPVAFGDIYHLTCRDEFLGGYISIGVLEHNPEGPEKALKEVYRVLNQKGFAFIAVPFVNSKRNSQLKKLQAHCNNNNFPDFNFYQFYYSNKEFRKFLSNAKLEIVEEYPYAVYSGLTRDFQLGYWLHQRGFIFYKFQQIVTKLCLNAPLFIRWRFAHMIMFVCKRAGE